MVELTQSPQRSVTLFPLTTPPQSKHVELSPPQTPHSSSPIEINETSYTFILFNMFQNFITYKPLRISLK